MGLVCIDRYYDLNTADISCSVLEAAGIPAFVFDRNFLCLEWFMFTALGGARLMVPSEHLTEAREMLDHAYASKIPDDEIDACPICGSHDAAHLYSCWAVLGTFFMVTLGGPGLGILVPYAFDRTRRRCENCSHFWCQVS